MQVLCKINNYDVYNVAYRVPAYNIGLDLTFSVKTL